jgi:tRNA(His) 5'-end guanylyltransferase
LEHTHALIGYTQSDEISLVWCTEDFKSDIFFSAKKQKMVSVLASLATAYFTRAVLDSDSGFGAYANRMPHFDSRVFQLPSREEAANAFLWRERDATKNAVSMAASTYYSHKQLHGKNSAEMQELLFQKGINFNDYPDFFKRGTFVRRVTEMRTLSEKERLRIPESRRPEEGTCFERSSVKCIEMPRFDKVVNRVDVIFSAAEPYVPTL